MMWTTLAKAVNAVFLDSQDDNISLQLEKLNVSMIFVREFAVSSSSSSDRAAIVTAFRNVSQLLDTASSKIREKDDNFPDISPSSTVETPIIENMKEKESQSLPEAGKEKRVEEPMTQEELEWTMGGNDINVDVEGILNIPSN